MSSKAGTSTSRALGPVVIAAAIALLALLLSAPGASAAGGIVVHESDERGATAERRSAGSGFAAAAKLAEPLALEQVVPEPAAPASGPRPFTPSRGNGSPGKPGFVRGTLPANLAAAAALSRAGERTKKFGKFTSRPVPEPTVYPNAANGKVVGQIKGVGLYSCSATVVHTKNKSTLFTAGHCVKEPKGKFARRFEFAPGYTDGNAPFGVWEYRKILVPKEWAKRGNINYDYAAVVLRRGPGARTVEEVVGSKGFAYSIPIKKKKFQAVGYPVNRGGANVMWECRDRFEGYDPGYIPPGPPPIGINCDMTSGASGGGWTIPGDYLASVSSFGYKQLREENLFGPRFTKKAEKLRKVAGRTKVR